LSAEVTIFIECQVCALSEASQIREIILRNNELNMPSNDDSHANPLAILNGNEALNPTRRAVGHASPGMLFLHERV